METFVVAEIGINHDGNVERAKSMIYEAKEAGTSAVKLQTYTLEERVNEANKQYEDLFRKCMLDEKEHMLLKEFADSIGIELFSTPFGTQSLEFLVNQMGVKNMKLASFDVTNRVFLRKVANICGKNDIGVILSTGMAYESDIKNALYELEPCERLSLLHCVSAYPTPIEKVNLAAIRSMKCILPIEWNVGYSDHTNGIEAPSLAVLLGARVIEKHFTLDLDGPGVDNPVSADPTMMKDMVNRIKLYEEMLGGGDIYMQDIEKSATIFRRFS